MCILLFANVHQHSRHKVVHCLFLVSKPYNLASLSSRFWNPGARFGFLGTPGGPSEQQEGPARDHNHIVNDLGMICGLSFASFSKFVDAHMGSSFFFVPGLFLGECLHRVVWLKS